MYKEINELNYSPSGVGSIIYNVTTHVNHNIAESWLQWLKEEHIPDMMATGCFTHATIMRLIEVDETQGPTYAMQYHATMRKKVTGKWDDQFIAFHSVLQVVN
jgi:hypothetical protein